VAAYSTSLPAQGDEGGLAALGEALAASARAPGHGGRLLYFAVASEVFFEQGAAMAARHPALYAVLRGFYGVDSDSWAP
jgi:Mlc titration factor MtfA (ptsG expression regulator)